ncbi:hypothetical protein AVEN_140128-1 [Araneus ventricosus]|uniref:Uncharacterized protein n=1 Tax=Araneus ventricosus TaxID=182803 RepID=A0A4Y2S834_ARAVE|nr:hypothetical protein AVEN_140128-1 [Araneus ventricosus]
MSTHLFSFITHADPPAHWYGERMRYHFIYLQPNVGPTHWYGARYEVPRFTGNPSSTHSAHWKVERMRYYLFINPRLSSMHSAHWYGV